MRKGLAVLFSALVIGSVPNFTQAATEPAPAPEKEWTLLVFMNGNNNLDSYGTMDLNEMEKVGSTDKVNVVVQWASMRRGSVDRVYVQKDNSNQVTSPAVEKMGRVDMGDWRNLVEFVRWGVKNYPAKHYFIDVWDHGTGWHALNANGRSLRPQDISHDDLTGNFMTTEQLGKALREAAGIIGHKVDIYGSDACLMAMAEVADEMSDSVGVFIGAEEVEPAKGWPYDALLARWNSQASNAHDVARILTEEYKKSYQGGSQGNQEVTLSALDLERMEAFNRSMAELGKQIRGLSAADRKKVLSAAKSTQNFTYDDYGDLGDFLDLVKKANVKLSVREAIDPVNAALSDFVIANATTEQYSRAKGVAVWLPGSKSTYTRHLESYKGLRFQANTSWADALGALVQ